MKKKENLRLVLMSDAAIEAELKREVSAILAVIERLKSSDCHISFARLKSLKGAAMKAVRLHACGDDPAALKAAKKAREMASKIEVSAMSAGAA